MKEIGDRLILVEGDYVNCGGKYYRYVGAFDSITDVPEINCIFRIGMDLFKRTVKPREMPKDFDPTSLSLKDDNSEKLNIPIDVADNELMIIIKELLRNYTKNDFNKLFTNETEKNNMKRVLETTNELTWKRFIFMLDLLGVKHTLTIEEKDD